MPGATGVALTYNHPNYLGRLINLTPTDTPFTTAMGNLMSGGDVTEGTTEFEWQTYDLRANGPRQKLEGQDAPQATSRIRSNVTNILEIHHEAVSVSYTKQAAIGNRAGLAQNGIQPVTNEFAWQTDQHLKQMKLDLEWSFLRSTYQKPSDNTKERKTRGLLPAIQTNRSHSLADDFNNGGVFSVTVANPGVFTTSGGNHGATDGDAIQFTAGSGVLPTAVHSNGEYALEEGRNYFLVDAATDAFKIAETPGGTPLEITDAGTGDATRLARGSAAPSAVKVDKIMEWMQGIYEAGGISEEETRTLMVGPFAKRLFTYLFITSRGYEEESRTVGGVHVTTIETDFGRMNLLLNRHMPPGSAALVSMEECEPVWLAIPGRGLLFVEMLGVVGAKLEAQLYCEVGLKYGDERKHGLLTHLPSTGNIEPSSP